MVHVGVCLYPRKAQKWMPATDRASVTTNMEAMCCHSCVSIC